MNKRRVSTQALLYFLMLMFLMVTVSCGSSDDTPATTTHAVTFDSQGATVAANPTSETVTSPATTVDTLPTAPAKTGFTFAGWWTGTNGTGTKFTATTAVKADITVYAKWITFDSITLADIQAVTLSNTDIDGSDANNQIPAGTIVVYKTKNGRYGKFLVDTWGHDLVLNWVTYNLANDGTVFSSGSNLTILGTWDADLDNGVEINGGTDAINGDFFWWIHSSTERAIEPEHGAMFAVYP
jgi:uncharacterized repeat protein (TIGR02543 family)